MGRLPRSRIIDISRFAFRNYIVEAQLASACQLNGEADGAQLRATAVRDVGGPPGWYPLPVDLAAMAQPHTGHVRITIWVRPGSARPGIGGEHAGALIVRVGARAVNGKATEAALRSVASAFGVRRSAVTLIAGASSRIKIVDVAGGDPEALTQLLGQKVQP
jgi:uncharacterized protein YggU (UPF0235/DUF167 family)